jgi:outer membrane receptor protein involved in Fe transport
MLSPIAARRSFSCVGRTVVSFVAVFLLCGQAFAQDAQPAPPTQPVQLPVISVTTPPPSRPTISAASNSVVVSPTTIPTPSYQSASSTTVITGADIESHQYRTVPDALSLVPGLNIVQTGGPGGQTSVFIRGTNSNHVKVLIDGIDASDPSNPNQSFDLGQLLPAILPASKCCVGRKAAYTARTRSAASFRSRPNKVRDRRG